MDIMESSRDLSELLDNDAAPDVVDQTRGLVEQVIKKVGMSYIRPYSQGKRSRLNWKPGARSLSSPIWRLSWLTVSVFHNKNCRTSKGLRG